MCSTRVHCVNTCVSALSEHTGEHDVFMNTRSNTMYFHSKYFSSGAPVALDTRIHGYTDTLCAQQWYHDFHGCDIKHRVWYHSYDFPHAQCDIDRRCDIMLIFTISWPCGIRDATWSGTTRSISNWLDIARIAIWLSLPTPNVPLTDQQKTVFALGKWLSLWVTHYSWIIMSNRPCVNCIHE